MPPYLTVIGNVFIDIKGFAHRAYDPYGKNIGDVRFVHGGVGRNVADNLAALGAPTRLVASVDDSALGSEVVRRLADAGVDTAYIAVAERGMGMWLAVMDEAGNVRGGISQQPQFDALQRTLDERGDDLVRDTDRIVLSVDLTERIARRSIELARRHRKPIYGLPGHFQIVMEHQDLLGELDCFICNHVEAGRLTGDDWEGLSNDRRLEALEAYMEARGVRAMVVTLGAEGAVYCDREAHLRGMQPTFPATLRDASGAGDAFSAGTVWALARGLPLDQAVVCGTKVAGWVIESEQNVCQDAAARMKRDPWFQPLLP